MCYVRCAWGELTKRLEVRNSSAGSLLTSCFLGGVKRFEGAELNVGAVGAVDG
jgi:hypothetical protein